MQFESANSKRNSIKILAFIVLHLPSLESLNIHGKQSLSYFYCKFRRNFPIKLFCVFRATNRRVVEVFAGSPIVQVFTEIFTGFLCFSSLHIDFETVLSFQLGSISNINTSKLMNFQQATASRFHANNIHWFHFMVGCLLWSLEKHKKDSNKILETKFFEKQSFYGHGA